MKVNPELAGLLTAALAGLQEPRRTHGRRETLSGKRGVGDGAFFHRRVKNMGIKEIITSRKSPWQNPYAERVIGSIRRERIDHLVVLGERHLRRILMAYVAYYNGVRPHLSLQRNAPIPRMAEPGRGRIIAIPQVGGLHHRYRRAA